MLRPTLRPLCSQPWRALASYPPTRFASFNNSKRVRFFTDLRPGSPPSSSSPSSHAPRPHSPPSPQPRFPPQPPPSSDNHSSLPTFLAHARLTGLSPTSTVYTGTHYEYTTIATLRRLRFDLTRIGGKNDYGVDLVGMWDMPPPNSPEASSYRQHHNPLKVIVQCKAYGAGTKVGPNMVRELEGAFVGAPRGWNDETGVLGVFVCPWKATEGVRRAMQRSPRPVVWIVLESKGGGENGTGLGRVRKVSWNEEAKKVGLEGLGCVVRYSGEGGEVLQKEAVLTWDGKPVKGLDEEQRERQGEDEKAKQEKEGGEQI